METAHTWAETPKTIYDTSRSWVSSLDEPASESDFSSVPSPCGFVRVWNSGTPEYNSSMKGLVDSLPWMDLFHHYVGVGTDVRVNKKRGNVQDSFGFSCGQSHQPRVAQNIIENFGAAVPSVRKGTSLQPAATAIEICSKVVSEAGAVWCDDDFLREHPSLGRRVRSWCNQIYPDCVVETITTIFMPLDGKASVRPHYDEQNCSECTQVVIIQRVVKDSSGK